MYDSRSYSVSILALAVPNSNHRSESPHRHKKNHHNDARTFFGVLAYGHFISLRFQQVKKSEVILIPFGLPLCCYTSQQSPSRSHHFLLPHEPPQLHILQLLESIEMIQLFVFFQLSSHQLLTGTGHSATTDLIFHFTVSDCVSINFNFTFTPSNPL
jgi:hypothetical protein